MRSLLWLRRDLRLHDHPALRAALDAGGEVIPVFCFDPKLVHGRHASASRTQFLIESLTVLDRNLKSRGSGLVVRHGDPVCELRRLAEESGARALHHSADAGPFARARDARVRAALGEVGVEVHAHPGMFVADDVGELTSTGGTPYTVFSPFWRSWSRLDRREVLAAPRKLPPLPEDLEPGRIPALGELGLGEFGLGELGLSGGVPEALPGGEAAARKRADAFLSGAITGYGEGHNALGEEASTSRLSPYLHFGCISPREVEARAGSEAQAWTRQLAWRDFYAHVILNFPRNARHEHQERYRGTLRWSHAEQRFEAWKNGLTGYPLVDAGMRQLLREGWMHNRARLVVGSFLTKDLAIDWRWGERWFMRMLIDGDEANNNGNWQWIASVGVDPQPAFKRIFNPARQQERFDAEGRYVRRYVPELREVPDRFLREPWLMPGTVQRSSGCLIGRDYPEPIVDHAVARRRALERYAAA